MTSNTHHLIAEADAAGDAWLAQALTALTGRTGLWAEAVRAGMFHRLLDEPLERKKEVLAAYLAGGSDPRMEVMPAWAGKLSPEQLQHLEDEAVAQCITLHADLSEVLEDEAFGTDDWRAGLQSLCDRRDELESVYIVLETAGAGGRALVLLSGIDEEGTLVRRCLPREQDYQPRRTVQLARARATAPVGWWTTAWPR